MTQEQQAVAAGPGLGRYREVLRTPGAVAFVIPGAVGRMPMAMLSLALVILLTAVTGSYGIAGAVSATAALLYAVVTPAAARLADRYGQARAAKHGRPMGTGHRHGGWLAVPLPDQAQHADHAERGGHQYARHRREAGG